MGNIETTTKFSRLKSISSIEYNYSFTLVIYLFSSVSLQLQGKIIILYCEENSIDIGFKELWIFKRFFKIYLFSGFSLKL